tara:strand:- start:4060 stop:5802 length:1743 start_codon:yes stop_codon:yes gene_type:complete
MNVINNILFLIEKKLRPQLVYIFFLTLIGTFLETLGVGIILPILTLIVQGKEALQEMINKMPFLTEQQLDLSNFTNSELVIFSIIFLIIIFFIKTIFFIFLIWRQNKFTYEVESYLSSRMFNFYLNKDYSFHTERNSSELFRNVKNEVGTFRHFIVMSSLTFLIEILVVASITFLILYLQPAPALSAAVFIFVVLFIFSKFNKKRLSKIGKDRQYYDALTIQHLNQGLDGIKEIKISCKEKEFLSIFDKNNLISIKSVAEQKFWILITKYLLEFVGVFTFMIIALFVVNKGYDLKIFLPTIGLVAAATFRFLPSAARIIQSINNIRFGFPSINLLCNELKNKDNITKNLTGNLSEIPKSFKKISFENISFSYPKSENNILQNTSFEVLNGDKIGILGPSGSGKSTLIDILTGLLEPSSGNIKLDDQNVNLMQKNWYTRIGYVPQFIFLTDDTIKKNVAFGVKEEEMDIHLITKSTQIAELKNFLDTCQDGIDTMIGEFGARISGGQRQRIGIARAIYSNSNFLIFDEATSAIDFETEKKIIDNLIKLPGKTMIIISHRRSILEGCNKIFEIEGRQISQTK